MSPVQERDWVGFWSETGPSFLKTAGKSVALLPIAVFVAVIVSLTWECFGGADGRSELACAVLRTPSKVALDLLGNLHWILGVTIFPLAAVLYLEWDKYKKDKPSGFVYGKFWNEGYRGYTTRKQELRQDKIMVGGHEVAAQVLGNDHRLFAGNFSEAHLNKHLKKYIGWWNKPIETTQGHEKWRILIRDGRELHIHLQRQATQPAHWIMTTKFYEWAGRNKPPQLAETHVTEFVCQG